MNIRPLYDGVVIERMEDVNKTAGGIVIPDTAKEKPAKGKVLEVGPGKWEDGKVHPLTVKKGDKVLFSKYAGTEFKLGDKEVTIMREHDILAVIEE